MKEIWPALGRKQHIKKKKREIFNWRKDMILELKWLTRTLGKSCKAFSALCRYLEIDLLSQFKRGKCLSFAANM